MTEYIRDNRSPIPKNEATSRVMSSNRRKNTSLELILRKKLRDAGFIGYRLQWHVPGRPDVCFPGRKVAIFVNGCFWHRCPRCNLPIPKTNTTFWKRKFQMNIERDERNIRALLDDDWIVHVIWECEIKNDLEDIIDKITPSLNRHRR